MNDIAILKATGFSGQDVKWIFLSQAFLIGFIGGLLGLALGFGVSVLIDNTPFVTEALPTISTTLSIMTLCFISSEWCSL